MNTINYTPAPFVSPRDIIVPGLPGAVAPICSDDDPIDEMAAFRRLRALERSLRPHRNKNDSGCILISAAIEEGFSHHRRIVGALETLDFHPKHIAILLAKDAKRPIAHRLWGMQSNGAYFNLR